MGIQENAEHFYESCLLHEDPSIDPDDHMAVIDAACITMTIVPALKALREMRNQGGGS